MSGMRRVVCCIACVLTPLSMAVAEETEQWYLGIGYGDAEVEVVGHDRSEEVGEVLDSLGVASSVTSAGEDDNSESYRLIAGYRHNPWWGVEFSYQDLGDTDGGFTALQEDGTEFTGKISSEYEAAALALMGYWPFHDRLSLMAKAGVHYWDHEFELRSDGNGIAVKGSESDDGFDLIYGFGVEAAIWKSLSMRLEWERFDGVEDEDGIDVKSANLIFRF